MTSSCSGALEHAIGVLADAGQNVLVPKPGFALYNCLTGAKQIEVRSYRLKVRMTHYYTVCVYLLPYLYSLIRTGKLI